MKKKIFLVVFIILIYSLNFAAAPPKPPKAASKAKTIKPAPPVVTQHAVKVKGKMLKYEAAAGCLEMKDEAGKQQALIFYVAYTKTGGDKTKRPVTFTFNGGPGSSSVWLHMGGLGPKRVNMSEDGLTFKVKHT